MLKKNSPSLIQTFKNKSHEINEYFHKRKSLSTIGAVLSTSLMPVAANVAMSGSTTVATILSALGALGVVSCLAWRKLLNSKQEQAYQSLTDELHHKDFHKELVALFERTKSGLRDSSKKQVYLVFKAWKNHQHPKHADLLEGIKSMEKVGADNDQLIEEYISSLNPSRIKTFDYSDLRNFISHIDKNDKDDVSIEALKKRFYWWECINRIFYCDTTSFIGGVASIFGLVFWIKAWQVNMVSNTTFWHINSTLILMIATGLGLHLLKHIKTGELSQLATTAQFQHQYVKLWKSCEERDRLWTQNRLIATKEDIIGQWAQGNCVDFSQVYEAVLELEKTRESQQQSKRDILEEKSIESYVQTINTASLNDDSKYERWL